MSAHLITVKNQPFFGRVEEQKQFRAALTEMFSPLPDEQIPYVLLLYGDAGIGKSTLAQRFLDIVTTEFRDQFKTLWLDWAIEQKSHPSLQVGRENINAEALFDVLYEVAAQQGWGKQFGRYRAMLKAHGEAEQKAIAVLASSDERDELAAVCSAGAAFIAKIIHFTVPVGEAGENLAKAFLEAGIKVGAEQAARLRATVENRLRTKLTMEQFSVFHSPLKQLALALAEGLKEVAERKPLLVFFDTYEIVDRVDFWLRMVIHAAGPHMLWVIAGRTNFEGYDEDFPPRLRAYNLPQLAKGDILNYFAARVPERPLSSEDLEAINLATRGIPLAIRQAADIWAAGKPLTEIASDISAGTPGDQIVRKMIERYQLHCMNKESDKQALYALALARGDIELLRAMLPAIDGSTLDLDTYLRYLERNYASVHRGRARLHDQPATFFLENLRLPVLRTERWVQALNEQAIAALRAKLDKLNTTLPLIEYRCADDGWVKVVLDLTYYLFWLDEYQAWHWFIPRFVESLAYSRDLQHGLMKIADDWEGWLDRSGKKWLKILRAVHYTYSSPEDEINLLDELTRLAELGWFEGEGETERRAILNLRRGQLLYRQRQFDKAFHLYEQAGRWLPEKSEKLKSQLVKALYDVSNQFIRPLGSHWPVVSEQGLRACELALALDKTHGGILYNYISVVLLSGAGEKAIDAYKRALAITERVDLYFGLAYAYYGLGNFNDAINACQRLIDLDPQESFFYVFLGELYFNLSRYDQALVVSRRAIELDPQNATAYHLISVIYLASEKLDRVKELLELAIRSGVKSRVDADIFNELIKRLNSLLKTAGEIKDPMPYLFICPLQLLIGQSSEALKSFEKALEIESDMSKIYDEWFDADNPAWDKLISELAPVIEILFPRWMLTSRLRSIALMSASRASFLKEQGELDKAIAPYKLAIDLDPQNVDFYKELGLVYRELGRHDEAIAAYQRAIDLDPKRAVLYHRLGQAYYNSGRYDKAIAAYERAITLDPNNQYAHNGLGHTYCKLGRYDEAIAACQRAIDLDPNNAYFCNDLGWVYDQSSHYDEAIAAYQRVIALDPNNRYAHSDLGLVYRELGRHEEAITTYQRAIALDPKSADLHASLADIFRKLGRETQYAEQIAIARELLAQEDEYSRACIEAICGNVEKALSLLKVALEKHQVSLTWARRDPDFDLIRDEPRFKLLVGQVS